MCSGKFPLMSMGGRAEGLACADPGARTRERGPPSAPAEILLVNILKVRQKSFPEVDNFGRVYKNRTFQMSNKFELIFPAFTKFIWVAFAFLYENQLSQKEYKPHLL